MVERIPSRSYPAGIAAKKVALTKSRRTLKEAIVLAAEQVTPCADLNEFVFRYNRRFHRHVSLETLLGLAALRARDLLGHRKTILGRLVAISAAFSQFGLGQPGPQASLQQTSGNLELRGEHVAFGFDLGVGQQTSFAFLEWDLSRRKSWLSHAHKGRPIRQDRRSDRVAILMESPVDIRPIRTDQDHRAALAGIIACWGAPEGTEEGEKLDVLIALVESYEARRWPIEPGDSFDPIDVLHYAVEELGHSQAELANSSRRARARVVARSCGAGASRCRPCGCRRRRRR